VDLQLALGNFVRFLDLQSAKDSLDLVQLKARAKLRLIYNNLFCVDKSSDSVCSTRRFGR
jgi:hypothetical protein